MTDRTAFVQLTTSGFAVFPWNYDAAMAPPVLERVVSAADLSAPVAPEFGGHDRQDRVRTTNDFGICRIPVELRCGHGAAGPRARRKRCGPECTRRAGVWWP